MRLNVFIFVNNLSILNDFKMFPREHCRPFYCTTEDVFLLDNILNRNSIVTL